MITLYKEHKISQNELALLQQLIGKQLIRIACAGVNLTSDSAIYDFVNVVNLSFRWDNDFICISGEFDETYFSDELIKLFINKENKPGHVKHYSNGALEHPFVNLDVYPDFVITKIDVYGYNYNSYSEKTDSVTNSTEKIVMENTGVENTIVFNADNQRMLVTAYGALPWIRVTFDDSIIDAILTEKDKEGSLMIKLKHSLG